MVAARHRIPRSIAATTRVGVDAEAAVSSATLADRRQMDLARQRAEPRRSDRDDPWRDVVGGPLSKNDVSALLSDDATADGDIGYPAVQFAVDGRYLVRHDPAQQFVGVGIFGDAGEHAWPVASTVPIGSDLVALVQRAFGFRFIQ